MIKDVLLVVVQFIHNGFARVVIQQILQYALQNVGTVFKLIMKFVMMGLKMMEKVVNLIVLALLMAGIVLLAQAQHPQYVILNVEMELKQILKYVTMETMMVKDAKLDV